MAVEELELRTITLPMAEPLVASHGRVDLRRMLLVRVREDGVDGWGECSALPAPTYTGEYVEGARTVLREWIGPAVLEGRHEVVRGHPMAWGAIRLARLDARLRREGRSLASHLGVEATEVPAGVVVNRLPIHQTLEAVDRYLAGGYRRIKLKVKRGFDTELIAAVRKQFGDDVVLMVDANAAYTGEDIDTIASWDRFGLAAVEQPFHATELVTHARLAARMDTPVALDESLTSLGALADAIALGAVGVACIKWCHIGGVDLAREAHDMCVEAGVAAYVGGLLDGGIGRAVTLALAGLPGFVIPGDISPTGRWFTGEPWEAVPMTDGTLAVPRGPGTGVDTDPASLLPFTESVEVLTA